MAARKVTILLMAKPPSFRVQFVSVFVRRDNNSFNGFARGRAATCSRKDLLAGSSISGAAAMQISPVMTKLYKNVAPWA